MTEIFQTESCCKTLLVIAVLMQCCSSLLRADDSADKTKQTLSSVAYTTVQLTSEQAALAGIESQTLQATVSHRQYLLNARVVSLWPLLDYQYRYIALSSKLQLARQQQTLAEESWQRSKQLSAAGITSRAQLNQVKQRWLDRQAVTRQLLVQLEQLLSQCRQRWGTQLTESVKQQSDLLHALQSGAKVLLHVHLPAAVALPAPHFNITITLPSQPTTRLKAELLDESPVSDSVGNARTFFFIADHHPQLRQGMLLDAWLNTDSEVVSGVLIPASAVIWQSGQSWVYVETESYRYVRHAVDLKYHAQTQQQGEAWFVSTGVKAGQRIVVKGAGLLLSEEFHWQIPTEDDD